MNKLVYWEILTTDLQASADFFAGLFGWRMERSTDDYMMFHVEGGMGGGLQLVDEPPGHGLMTYVQVEDIPATLERIRELGGTVLTEKTDIGQGHGFWAGFEAPGGCRSVSLYASR